MDPIEVLAALATILAAGFGALTLILRDPKCLSFAEQLALSWLGGTGIVSLSIWLFGFVLSGPALFSVVSFICVALPLVAWKTKGAFRLQELRRPSPIELALACILSIEILAVGCLAFAYTLGWDGLLNWEIKARYAFANGDVFRIYAVCLAFLPWVKREGVILWLIAAIYGAFVIWRSKRSPKYLCALLSGLCIVLAWRIYLIQMHAVSSSDFMEVNLVNLRANIHRFGPILSGFAYEVTDLRAWGLFWLVAGLAGVYFVRRLGGGHAIVLIVSIVAPLAAYASM